MSQGRQEEPIPVMLGPVPPNFTPRSCLSPTDRVQPSQLWGCQAARAGSVVSQV